MAGHTVSCSLVLTGKGLGMSYTPHHVLHRHVLESNAIEGIDAKPGHPLYDSHMHAAHLAASGRFVHPQVLHAALGVRVPGLSRHAGQYRQCEVCIQSLRTLPHGAVLRIAMAPARLLPRARHVPGLMAEWDAWAKELCERFASVSREDRANVCHYLHAWQLCIHGFEDGNGRTARLSWNNLRVCVGLPWIVQPARFRSRYYARIRAVEEQSFKPQYPDIYDR